MGSEMINGSGGENPVKLKNISGKKHTHTKKSSTLQCVFAFVCVLARV